MTSAVSEEFLALLSIKHVQGAAFTPRHQGPGERAHQTIMNNHLLLMNEVCSAFPQEWAALVPALEYLCETAPREPHGLSAFDLSQGFGLLVDTDRRLAPFSLPWGLPETEVASRLFEQFRELYGMYSRCTAEEVLKKQEELNRKRTVRIFDKGEVVFRKLPSFARPAKHLLGDRCTGPYLVTEQRSLQSAVLTDPSTGQLVDKGRNIPLDQLLTGPRRSKLLFDPEPADIRGIGEMLRGEGAPPEGPNSALLRRAGHTQRVEFACSCQPRRLSYGGRRRS